MASSSCRSWVEISLGKLAQNYRAIQAAAGEGVELAPVVKADAYRHGAVEVSRTLVKEGAGWLSVSNTEEGVELRQAGVQARILVMADCFPASQQAQFEYGLTPVIHSLEDLRELDRKAAIRERPFAYHLKIDTGMSRLGTTAPGDEIAATVAQQRYARLEGLMTHFASAGDYASSQTDDQIKQFERVVECLGEAGVRPKYLHLASTIPIAYGRTRALRNMVRPGHALYGYVSPARGHAPSRSLQVEPLQNWKASVLAVKEIPAGARVGYGGMYRAAAPMRIAVLAAGYADGIPHRLSNRGSVIACGRKVPILGAVSMDLTTIDVTQVPQIRAGGAVTLMGCEGEECIDAQEIAKLAGTISYTVLCGIHSRVKRVYV